MIIRDLAINIYVRVVYASELLEADQALCCIHIHQRVMSDSE